MDILSGNIWCSLTLEEYQEIVENVLFHILNEDKSILSYVPSTIRSAQKISKNFAKNILQFVEFDYEEFNVNINAKDFDDIEEACIKALNTRFAWLFRNLFLENSCAIYYKNDLAEYECTTFDEFMEKAKADDTFELNRDENVILVYQVDHIYTIDQTINN